ncbi:MAG: succinylglutamate desuccinylase/aspartoacylase family protein [Deltaproteobacteria bacterium]|nr:succinylglutamate desuccinylase/aspartoacylase family protein [Deltaproteobacteria bacterium]
MTLELATPETAIPRVIGSYGGNTPGPLVICIGGMHGNEPAGIFAARQVLQYLYAAQPPFRGQFIALSGNRAALGQRCRYIGQDLNRMWTAERIAALRASDAKLSCGPEEREQRELLTTIEAAIAQHRGPVVFLDLHTTSAEGVPFTVIGDTILNRRLAMSLPAPVILGLEEHLDGTTLNYINDLGYIAVGFEGGQNETPSSVDHHQVAIWTVLQTVGCLRSEHSSSVLSLRQQLAERTKTAPRIVEIRYRHAIQEGDNFVMEPGFQNFYPVKRRQLLAHDRRGEIRAPEDGFVLMPLYQSQGADGFFLVREVRPFWLQVATWCRRLRLEKMLPWLPGIQRHPTLSDTLLVNPRIARWFVVELLHLLGFRKQRPEGNRLVVSRRPHDVFSFEEWR